MNTQRLAGEPSRADRCLYFACCQHGQTPLSCASETIVAVTPANAQEVVGVIRWLLVAGTLVLFVVGCSSQAAPTAPTVPSAANVPSVPDAVAELLAKQGWQPTGPQEESTAQLPADFKLRSGFPWRYVVDYSLDVGLNLEPYAGHTVRMVIVPVTDVLGGSPLA